jgi:8-oxo-dGTP pyrophosphatase MutT (NUDIX family)
MIDVASALALVESFPASEETKSRELILGLLRHGAAPFSREHFTPGHITSTGVVLHPDRQRVLVIHHARLERWLLPGGHVEAEDGALWQAARREVQEETGVAVAGEGWLAGMDVHGIPPKRGEPYHLHHDLKFAFVARDEMLSASDETRGAGWCPIDEAAFDQYGLPPSIRRAIRRAIGRALA